MGENVLVIYDNTGYIIQQLSGSGIRQPVGVPYMITMVPTGKRLVSIDVSGEQPIPVFENIPPTTTDTIKEQLEALIQRMNDNDATNLMVLEAMADVYEAVLPFLPV